jgi:hypothetical protein
MLGIPGLLLLLNLWPDKGWYLDDTQIFLVSGLMAVIVLVCYYYAAVIIPFIVNMVPFKAWRDYLKTTLNVLSRAIRMDLHMLLILSILRTLTYTFQYFLTILFFSVKLGLYETTAAILSVYLLKTVVPYLPATGLIVRSEISLWVFSAFTQQLTLILAASILIWVINVVVPAIWGYFLILTTDLNKES